MRRYLEACLHLPPCFDHWQAPGAERQGLRSILVLMDFVVTHISRSSFHGDCCDVESFVSLPKLLKVTKQ
jgi:hypothetical protein